MHVDSQSDLTAATRASHTAVTVALTTAIGLTIASWVTAVREMSETGMDMGVATQLGSFGFFVALWVPMMAAMMLPGALPVVASRARAIGRPGAGPVFILAYLAVWTFVGVAVYAVYQPHGTSAAGAVVIAAGCYELTPLKRHCRRLCREGVRSGLDFGVCCVGSSLGLMLILVALGVMSIGWMLVVTAIVLAQKLLPERSAIDVPLAVVIVVLGVIIIVSPESVPGLTPSM